LRSAKKGKAVMSYTLVPFTQAHLEPAVALFIEAYRQEQGESPLLPSRTIDDPGWIRGALQSHLDNPGVAVIEQGHLLAYMLTGPQFPWKGQRCALVPEYGHSASVRQKQALYQSMYMCLAQEWVKRGLHIHLIAHLAHDRILQETLYQLGYGAILAERLRDLSPIATRGDIAITEERDVGRVVALEMEHNQYYPKSPIFLQQDASALQVRADLEAHIAQGDAVLVYNDGPQPGAYIIVGTSSQNEEGLLLRNTNTAQIKTAYARPKCRGKGIGAALLYRAILWAESRGYARLFVEHETANVYGGNFWRKHFTPYVTISMRYVDNTL
jgi:GNAT superfamily N-acetyltransferase